MEEIRPPIAHDDDITIVTSNRTANKARQPTQFPTDVPTTVPQHTPMPMPSNAPTTAPRRSPRLNPRKENGTYINSKRNDTRISKKRLQKLIDEQTARDKQLVVTQLKPVTTNKPNKIPTGTPLITFHHVSPKGGNHPTTPTITQEDANVQHNIQHPIQHYPIQKFHNNPPAAISQEALYHIVGIGYNDTPLCTVPRKLELSKLTISPAIEIEELCNGVVHPVTNETITKYKKLASDPLLQKVWKKAMAKELGRLAQGFGDTDGTDTIRFLSLDEIKCIPADRTITYARIVVDYRPQKEDPNRVRITAGGNLIDYPYELTTRTADLTTTKIM